MPHCALASSETSRELAGSAERKMRDGYKIVDTDSHMMEPEWLWEKYIADRYKAAAPKMGNAPDSGRRTFIV